MRLYSSLKVNSKKIIALAFKRSACLLKLLIFLLGISCKKSLTSFNNKNMNFNNKSYRLVSHQKTILLKVLLEFYKDNLSKHINHFYLIIIYKQISLIVSFDNFQLQHIQFNTFKRFMIFFIISRLH